MKSKAWKWNEADWIAWKNQAIKVSAPYLVVIIPVIISQIDDTWAYSAILIYVLQRIYNWFLLYKAGK